VKVKKPSVVIVANFLFLPPFSCPVMQLDGSVFRLAQQNFNHMILSVRKDRDQLVAYGISIHAHGLHAVAQVGGVLYGNLISSALELSRDLETVPLRRNGWVHQQSVRLRPDPQDPVCGHAVQPLRGTPCTRSTRRGRNTRIVARRCCPVSHKARLCRYQYPGCGWVDRFCGRLHKLARPAPPAHRPTLTRWPRAYTRRRFRAGRGRTA